MSATRLVAVLGYSGGRHAGLHPVCAARITRATAEATERDVVLLTGWSRRGRAESEAALMAAAWNGRAREVRLDHGASTTYGNARAVAHAARELAATEIVLVTSGWHGRRAAALVRASVRDLRVPVRVAATGERGRGRDRARELACWALVPFQSARAARSR